MIISFSVFGLFFGIIFCNFIYYFLFRVIPRYHILGISYFLSNDIENAEKYFDKSILFFRKWHLIDGYAYYLFFNSPNLSFLESSLLNKATILTIKGDNNKALSIYEEIILINPKNIIAKQKMELLKDNY